MAFMFSISALCDSMIDVASWLTSGSSVRLRMALAIGMAASWWEIMSLKNKTSALSGGSLNKLSNSSGVAIPGIRPSVG